MQRKEVIDPSTNNRLTLPSASSRKESRYEDQREIHEDSKAYVPTGAPKNFNIVSRRTNPDTDETGKDACGWLDELGFLTDERRLEDGLGDT